MLRGNIFCKDPTFCLCGTNKRNPCGVIHWKKSNKLYHSFFWRAQTLGNIMKLITIGSGTLTHQSNNELPHSVLCENASAYSDKSWKSLVKKALSVKWWPNRYVLNHKDWTSWGNPFCIFWHFIDGRRSGWKIWRRMFFYPNGIFCYQSCNFRINSSLILNTWMPYGLNFYQVSHTSWSEIHVCIQKFTFSLPAGD